ncbi:MAG TPA: translocation/assembly module TamB domain-containing protein, partial [Clostridia bacterium]|nr:translocation/assembly module TamB domain-containing protein [Clostridia bacterium]
PQVEIQRLKASGDWTNGPVNFDVELSGGMVVRHSADVLARQPAENKTQTNQPPGAMQASLLETPMRAQMRLSGNGDGVTLSNLVVTVRNAAVAKAQGFLPVTVVPEMGTNLIRMEADKPLALVATAQAGPFLRDRLARAGVSLQDPELSVRVNGTWQAPQGEAQLRVRQVHLTQTSREVPALTELQVKVVLDEERARLAEGQILVQGQLVSLTGELPLGKNFWANWDGKTLPDWRRASARLRVENAEIAAFEPIFPKLLAPQGELLVDVSLSPGLRLDGGLRLQNARTRPLANTGPIRDISANIQLSGHTIRLERASADLSGAKVVMTGQADLSDTNWLQGAIPPFRLTLRGNNVPLARQPEFIIRSDLDLAVTKTNGAPALVSGAAHLRDSYYLSDLTALVPGKVQTPRARPPYFSIDDPLLADWRLALTVDGVRFLKVRSPLFNGEVSANLRLQGTLKDPVALGDLRVDSGTLRFPFASLQVQQGLITLTSQDPYRPQLLVSAASKQFGYDIRMEASGGVDAPVVQFSSTPPLSSEQILLMVTAGEMPRGTVTLTPQQRAQTMALFLGRDLLAKLGVGDQGQERLTIRSGEQISEQGRPTYNIEYKLSDDWSVVGEYDRFGGYNAGLKWRIYSR